MSHNGSNKAPGRSHTSGQVATQVARTLANKKRRLTREVAQNPANVSAAEALKNLRYKKPQGAWTKEPTTRKQKVAAV